MSETRSSDVPELPKTLYELAGEEMQRLITIYLRLLEETNGLANVGAFDVAGVDERRIILAGLGALEDAEAVDGAFVAQEVQRRSAVPFDVESGITTGVYLVLRERVARQIESLADETDGCQRIDAAYVEAHPHLLPMFMRIGGVFSKAELKKIVGSASDQRIGKVAATKLSELVSRQVGSARGPDTPRSPQRYGSDTRRDRPRSGRSASARKSRRECTQGQGAHLQAGV